jgi:hypothetical protein
MIVLTDSTSQSNGSLPNRSVVPDLGSAEMQSLPIRTVGELNSNNQSWSIGDLEYEDDCCAPMGTDDSDGDLPLSYELAIRGGRETSNE